MKNPFTARATKLPVNTTPYPPLAMDVVDVLAAVQAQYGSGATWVNETTVAGLPAANACLEWIADMAGLMTIHANAYNLAGQPVPLPNLIANPCPALDYTPYEFWTEAYATVIMHGNYIAISEGESWIPVHPSKVEPRWSGTAIEYRIGNDTYPADSVLHIRGRTVPGNRWGLGVVTLYRLALAAQLDQADYAHQTYTDGSVPSYVAVVKGKANQEQLDNIVQSISAARGGGVALSAQDADIKTLTWSPENSQLLQARAFAIAEIAYMFKMDPTDVGAVVPGGVGMTYANISQRNTERLKRTFLPWTTRFEQAIAKHLPQDIIIKANPEALLRADAETRYNMHATGIAAGFLTRDEARELEDRPPLGDQSE